MAGTSNKAAVPSPPPRFGARSRTGTSSATISRVNRSLHYGKDSYWELFRKLKEQEK